MTKISIEEIQNMFSKFDNKTSFKKGDVVSLKSGSCNLTIESFNEDNSCAKVVWFTDTDEYKTASIPTYALDLEEND